MTDSEKIEKGVNDLPQLEPATQKIVNECINEVLSEYINETKYFTADTLHHLRAKITHMVQQKLGDDVIKNIDIILNLTEVDPIPLAFRVNIPKEKAEEHILNKVELEEE